ncbi:hypothetical protein GOM49_12545 [Clostridium bovifaecis]|uniref:Uncharacterized protein n=1 Tax=Clostridium bovifaecis TaxID=2184719 RepID=A0A6I6ETY0_9CLOT|nr:hypothetical protein GOM49_12545 [Clostridium bovifaecis]
MRFNKETVNMKTILYAGIVGVVLLVIIIASFTSKGSKLEKKNIAFERKAEEHLYLGEYDKAIEEYTKINTNKEKDNKLLALKNIDIANAHFLKGDVENYKKYVQLTKDLKVQDEDIVNKIVFYEYINGDGSQALKDGEEALKANSKNKSLVKSMVAIYMANNKTDKVKELIKLYGVDKNSAYDIAEYSRLLMMSGDMKGGFTKLKEAWNLDKDEYKIYDVLAQESAYDLEKVISSIKELQKNDPNDIAYKVWLAKVYSLSPEKAKEGLQILEQLKSKNVGNIEIKLIEASILQNMNKHKESDRLINEVIQSNKDDYKALHTAGWFYLNKHDLEKAMEYCKRSIEQNKNYPDNYAFLMPEILKSMDKASLAKTYFMTALEKEPYNYNILENAASFYWDADEIYIRL